MGRVAARRAQARRAVTVAFTATLLALLFSVGALWDSEKADAHAAGPYAQLSELRVKSAGTMAGYSRGKFPHWSDAQEYNWKLPASTPDPGSCDVRDGALIRDGRREVVHGGCDVVRGRWFDPYTGRTYYRPSDIDIDHMVPLANAWRSGARRWTTARRERFANVPFDVLSVEDNANASKGDSGPESWKPPRKAYWCAYSKRWIGIKHAWKLSVTSPEKKALKQMLGTCGR